MGLVLYGITGCDTVRKARGWLEGAGLDYEFHDYRKRGVDETTLQAWCQEFGWQSLVNRRGTTWRKLAESQRSDLDEAAAIALMLEHTSLIKRPVLEYESGRLLGFDAAAWAQALD